MSIIHKQLELLLIGGQVRRFHTVPVLKEQTVAAHSHGVVLLTSILLGAGCRSEALVMAALHDMGEWSTGDIPSPAKRRMGISDHVTALEDAAITGLGFTIPECTPEELRAVKMADCFEGMLFCISERAMGNRAIKNAFSIWLEYVAEMEPKGTEQDVLRYIVAQWRIQDGR